VGHLIECLFEVRRSSTAHAPGVLRQSTTVPVFNANEGVRLTWAVDQVDDRSPHLPLGWILGDAGLTLDPKDDSHRLPDRLPFRPNMITVGVP
jgi:hypothetical protein